MQSSLGLRPTAGEIEREIHNDLGSQRVPASPAGHHPSPDNADVGALAGTAKRHADLEDELGTAWLCRQTLQAVA